MSKNFDFTFSDLIAGYVESADQGNGTFELRTGDGRVFPVKLTDTTFAEMMRNLGEPYIDCTQSMRQMLEPGRYMYAYGIFFPEENTPFEAKHIVFAGRNANEFRFEKKDWWIKQIEQLGDFYLKAQFADGEIDYKNYRTELTLEGASAGKYRQETDTISRLIYGFASAYLLTGKEKYLEAAEKGTDYLRDHFRAVDTSEDIVYWYHAIDIDGDRIRKILASEFGDDYDAIPAYEQIYALAGPVQTYRITGDSRIYDDAQKTINLFEKYFLDRKLGGYFSHIDPIMFDPRAESLGQDRARKNWNSVGDHTPAYLINLYLATGEEQFANMLLYTADLICKHFPDYENSAFVQEKFHEDWSKDQSWGWQQNRAVVGHNLKIAWNLTRVRNMTQKEEYEQIAKKIAELMPEHGGDKQRGGWYDVVERILGEGEEFHRYAWHDRKAWWQQEQGILAYLILNGTYKEDDYLKIARESSSFYNAWFLDHDSGGVYFNVLANGIPYLMGTEREKGSHSMSGYHSFELCYLAAIYSNLLITKQPMDFHFKPHPRDLKNRILRVAPDILPEGSIKIESVTVDGRRYDNFDAEELTVTLPESDERVKVVVRIVPTSGLDTFRSDVTIEGSSATIVLSGKLDLHAVPHFREDLNKVLRAEELTIDMSALSYICPEAVRSLIFAKQKSGIDEKVRIIGAENQPKEMLDLDEFSEEIEMV